MESKVDKLLKQIAEQNPWVQKAESLFPDPASRFGPSALAMTRQGAAAKIIAPYLKGKYPKTITLPEVDRMLKAIKVAPKKLVDFLDDIKYTYGGNEAEYIPKGWNSIFNPSSINLRANTWPSFSRPLPLSRNFQHEMGHLAEDVAVRELGGSLNQKLYNEHSAAFEGLADWFGQQSALRTGTPYTTAKLESLLWNEPLKGAHAGMEDVIRTLPQKFHEDPFQFVKQYLNFILR